MIRHLIPFAGYPIFVMKNEFNLKKEELSFLKNLKYKKHVSGNNLKLSVDTNILELKKLQRLKKFIENSLNIYVSNVLEIKNKFSFCQSWSTIQNGKAYHPKHAHPNHIISSVYYAKADETSLIFRINKSIIQDGFFFDYDIKNYNFFNSDIYTIPLKTGDIIFFPGQLNHESVINNEKERIIVGSSFFIEGKIGNKNNKSNFVISTTKDE